MRDNPKLVLFEKNAAYLHHRAMMNRRDNNAIDALELLRGAVEASPDNREYRLDLAELYCEMGCHGQSSRLLLDMLCGGDAPSECLYGLALNQLGMNDIEGAKRSLRQYRRRSPKGEHMEEVQRLTEELDMLDRMNRPANRRLLRAMREAERACDAMKGDDPERAKRLFERTLERESEQYEMRALYAMVLMMLGDTDAARREADRALGGYPPSVRALCVCAQVYCMLGDQDGAVALMDRAAAEHPSGQELRLMIYAAGEIGLYDRAAEYARLAMQETPFDRELMHIRAVALKKSGEPDETAARCWARILRIDPDDTIADYYHEAAVSHALDDMRLEFGYQVPEQEYMRRLELLVRRLGMGFEHIRVSWEEDPEFRRLVRWAVDAEDMRLGRASMTVLATVEAPEALSVLREVMFAPDVPRDLKLHAALLMKLQGRSLKQVVPEGETESGDMLVDAEALLSELPVGDRQLVRYADEVLQREYDISARPALTLMWQGYRKLRGTRGDPVKRMDAAAAALAYNYLLASGQRPAIAELAAHFGCTPRQLVFFAERIAARLDRKGDAEDK